MDATKIGDLVRTLVGAFAGFAVAKGWGDADLWVGVGGALALLATAVYGWKFGKKAA